jgi:hypothetical protein
VTYIKHTKTAAALALGAMVALAALASPASARWNGNGQWQQDNRQWENHYNGYNCQAPPVVYSTPYNYGYQPPPVVYEGGAPSISIQL